MPVCVISFSSRKSGNCAGIGRYVRDLCAGAAELFAFSEFAIEPCGRCDYECFGEGPGCPHRDDQECALIERVMHGEMSYFIVPNYCDFPCANFFIFSERSQCYFQKYPDRQARYALAPKKFIVVSNTGRENFRAAFAWHAGEAKPDILFVSARSYHRSSIDGDILASGAARDDIRRFVLR